MRRSRAALLLISLLAVLLILLYARVGPTRPRWVGAGRSPAERPTEDRDPRAGGTAPPIAARDASGLVEGVVRDRAGRPIAGAKVVVSTPDVTASAFTDAEGRYRIDGLPRGRGQLVVRAPRHVDLGPRELSIGGDSGSPLDLELGDGQTLSGRVLDGQGAVPGIRVRVDGESAKECVTSRGGDYRIDGLPPGHVTIVAGSGEYPEVETRILVVAGRNYRDLTVHRGAAVAGRVADTAGRAIAGARVNVLGRMEDWVLSGDDGGFALHGVPAEARITATHADYCAAGSDKLQLQPGERLGGVELVMRRSGVVRGSVVTAERAPAAGVRVGLDDLAAEGGTRDIREPTTDATGAFQVARVPPGRYRVVARGAATTSTPEVELGAEGATVDDVLLVLAATGSVRGRVEDTAGAPVKGAIVEASTARAVTGEDGAFTLTGLPAGERRVRARLPVGGAFVEATAGEDEVVLRLPAPGALAGSVTGAEGAAELRVMPEQGDAVRIPVGAGGAFRVDGVAPGRYELFARTSGGGRSATLSPVVVEAGRETGGLALHITAGETLRGRVLLGGETPAAGVAVVARAKAGDAPEPRTATNADGSFALEGLVAGTYRLELTRLGLTELSEEIRVPRHTEVALAFPRVTTLTIRVTDGAGTPVAGASVRIDNRFGAVHGEAKVTDATGVCRCDGVPEGEVTVTVSATGHRVALRQAEVAPDGSSEVSIVLEPR